MSKFHVKKGDEVVVIAGAHRTKRGKIKSILKTKNRVVVEGVNMVKKHLRKSQQNPQGAILEIEGSIHVSNVVKAEAYDARKGAAKA
ncbi:MAG TPA: 50S ribosomal protein L24 [Verrucomicrobiae bacterium]